jgi:hypothetical protein
MTSHYGQVPMNPGPNNTLWFTGATWIGSRSFLGRIDVDIPN